MSDLQEPSLPESSGESPNPYATPEAMLGPAPSAEEVGELVLASRWARFGGAFIDGLILTPITIGIWFVLGIGSGMLDGQEVGLLPEILAGLLSAAVYIAINYHLWEKNGQSIGKLAVGTKIVRTNGERCRASRIVSHRYLPITVASQVPIIGGILALVDALLIFRGTKKCLHDDIADTIVIKT